MNFTISPELRGLLEQMSRDMAVPVEALVNQAVFNWARLHGVLEPSVTSAPPPPPPQIAPVTRAEPPPEPETTRVPVVAEPEPEPQWSVVTGGTFENPAPKKRRDFLGDATDPSVRSLERVFLVLPDGEVEVTGERFVIGRDVSCDLTLDSPRLSRQHVAIVTTATGVEVHDLHSSNGTWYQGERITTRPVSHGDEFFFGDVPVKIELR